MTSDLEGQERPRPAEIDEVQPAGPEARGQRQVERVEIEEPVAPDGDVHVAVGPRATASVGAEQHHERDIGADLPEIAKVCPPGREVDPGSAMAKFPHGWPPSGAATWNSKLRLWRVRPPSSLTVTK